MPYKASSVLKGSLANIKETAAKHPAWYNDVGPYEDNKAYNNYKN